MGDNEKVVMVRGLVSGKVVVVVRGMAAAVVLVKV